MERKHIIIIGVIILTIIGIVMVIANIGETPAEFKKSIRGEEIIEDDEEIDLEKLAESVEEKPAKKGKEKIVTDDEFEFKES